MGEKNIDFITKKSGARSKEEEKEKEELKWSDPAPLAQKENKENKGGEKRLPRLFSFFQREKKVSKENIKNLRAEVLKTIREKEEKNTPILKSEEIKGNGKNEKKESKIQEKEIPQEKKAAPKKGDAKKITEPSRERWESADVLETNLIEGEMVSFFNFKKNLVFLITTFSLVILILGGIYLWLYFWEKEIKQTKEALTPVVETQNQKVVSEEKKEIYVFARKLELVEYLLNKHVYWTNFLRFLEENTLNDVYYTSLSGDLGGSYVLPAVTKNYSLISQQIEILLKNEKIKGASVKSGQFSAGADAKPGAVFNLDLKINPNIFFKDGNKK